MRSLLFGVFYFLLIITCFSQAGDRLWIQFTDKNNGPYLISQPLDFLSQKSVDRRTKQGIVITNNDIPVTPAYLDSIRNTGVNIMHTSKWFNAATIQTTDSAAIAKILSFPFVKNTIDTVAKRSSNKTMLKDKFELENKYIEANTFKTQALDYGASATQTTMINLDKMHDKGYRGDSMVIAVLDNGFNNVPTYSAFDSLWLENRILGTRDFYTGDTNVFNDGSHGMNVLSVMGANLPGIMVGAAPKASYWLCRTEISSEQRLEEDNWVAAAEFADSVGADIITSSLGYSNGMNSPSIDHTYAEMDGNTTRITIGADIAATKGILVVNSAGNEGASVWRYVNAPADGDSVLSVGAVSSSGAYAFFSSQGPTADGRIKPNVSALGLGAAVIIGDSLAGFSSGTSFSAPLISGAAACLWQANPTKTSMEIFNAIEKSSSQYDNPDNFIGYGIPDFNCADLLLKDSTCPEPPIPVAPDSNLLYKPFPNPFRNSFEVWVSLEPVETGTIKIYNLVGQEVLTNEFTSNIGGEYQLIIQAPKEWFSGVYIVEIFTRKQNYSGKLVKF